LINKSDPPQLVKELSEVCSQLTAQEQICREQQQELAELNRRLDDAESERKLFKAVMEILPVSVFIADKEGKLIATNLMADQVWEKAPLSNAMNDYATDYKAWWPSTGQRVKSHEWGMARAISKGERCFAEEMEIETPDGQRKFILNYALPILDIDGEIAGGVAVNVDITERKHAENNLRLIEERYHLVNQATNDIIWDWDLTTDKLSWNQTLKAVGLTDADMPQLGKSWYTLIHPDDRDRVIAGLHQAFDSGKSNWSDEYRFGPVGGPYRVYLDRGLIARDKAGVAYRIVGSMLDLTEQRQHEQMLRESEERMRLSVEAANQGTWDLDLQTDKAVRSFRHDQIWGFNELQPEWGLEIAMSNVVPEDRAGIIDAYNRGKETGVLCHENRIVHPNGNIRWIRAYGHFKYDDEGRPVRVMGIVEDITERKRSEEALEAERARLQAVLDSLPVAVWIADHKGTVIQVNNAVEQIWGKTAVPFSIKKYRKYKGWWADTGKSIEAEDWALARAVLKGEVSTGEVIDIERFNGERATILNNAAPVKDQAGRIIGGVAVAQDITKLIKAEQALRESEEKFRTVFEQAAVGIGRVSFTDARWIEVNDTFCRMLGYTPEEFLETPWPKITHPEDVDLDLIPFRRMAAGELESYTVEKRFIHKHGPYVWARLTLSLVRDSYGLPHYEIAIIENLNDKKVAEDSLRESEEQFRTVVENMSEGLMLFDEQGMIFQNSASLRIHGFKGPIEMRIEHRDLPTKWKGWDEKGRLLSFDEWPLSRVLRYESFQDQVLRAFDVETGREFWASYNGFPILGADGKLKLGFITIRDITENKRAQDALRESERRYRALFTNMGEGFALGEALLDETSEACDFRFLEINQAFERQTGLSNEIIGHPITEVLPHLERHWIDTYCEVAVSGKPVRFKNYNQDTDRHYDVFCFSPSINRFAILFHDITEQVETENAQRQMNEMLQEQTKRLQMQSEKLQAKTEELSLANQELQRTHGIIESITKGTDDLIAAQDSDFRYIYFNDAYKREFTKLWGRKIEKGTSMVEALSPWPEDQRNSRDLWGRALKGESFSITEAFGRSELGKQVYQLQFNPLYDNQGRQIGAAHILRNVTEQVRLQKKLLMMNETLEQQVAERTRLAEQRSKQLQALAIELIETEERERRNFAHFLHEDLQQMLAAACMNLQSLSKAYSHDYALSDVNLILKEAIEKSRCLSQAMSPPILNHLGLSAALEWLGQRMAEQFDLKVELEVSTEPVLDNTALKTFIFRSTQELLFNIVKHSETNRAHIVLSGSDSDISITVIDYGKGFEPGVLRETSAGFGLLTIRERASYIGGNLKIESVPEKGSRFTITVPLDAAYKVAAVEHDSDTLLKNKDVTAPANLKARVLLVDDHTVIRQGLIKLLNDQPNIKIVGEAANGQEAIEQARKIKPDLILMDISMPVMDGIEATRKIKAEFPYVRVIGLSMYMDEQSAQSMRYAGAENYIVKTATPKELLQAIYGTTEDNSELT
jgi:PAS domain S-box-containing protein